MKFRNRTKATILVSDKEGHGDDHFLTISFDIEGNYSSLQWLQVEITEEQAQLLANKLNRFLETNERKK